MIEDWLQMDDESCYNIKEKLKNVKVNEKF